MDTLEVKKTQRFLFMNRLHEKTNGNQYAAVNMWEIGQELGLTQDQTELAVQYLEGEKLLEFGGWGGYVSITHYGVRQVEEALSKPDEPTQYFPPVHFIHVENMSHSVIQQGTHDST